ncbi:hypothetical protein OX284_016295 [Flavobacterium sp. SUN046]|uniref:hypothetical protein n=1 Tax=Flavobacterium sp. SUN046 TaxID=3002440 RepID=UPI002DBF0BCC|nr:hypothetical protein [Flavobacterium sp. SUN046]MEC4050997.1 hypothetical protein [Flavobacterium sp. SUN046]
MDYIPRSRSLLVTWLLNFKIKIVQRASELGLEADEVTALVAICDKIVNAINDVGIAKATYDSVVKNQDLVLEEGVTSLRGFIGRIKKIDEYTATMGEDLGILTSESSVDYSTYKPSLRGEAHPGYVLIKFSKKGVDGINLYGRNKGDSEWKRLNFYMFSPSVDSRPLAVAGHAENREYMCIGVVKDHEIGLQSDIISIAFAG